MVFSSITFIVFFLIVSVFLAFSNLEFFKTRIKTERLIKFRQLFLIIASYVFYGWWDWRFLILIAITTLLSFLSGIGIEKPLLSEARKQS